MKKTLKLFSCAFLLSVLFIECNSYSIADWLTSLKKIADKKVLKNNEREITTTSTSSPKISSSVISTKFNDPKTHKTTDNSKTTKYSIKITPFNPIVNFQ